MNNKKYVVYQIINKLNKMIYIGCHVTENANDSYKGSGTNIKKAIKEYGLENFEKIILFQFDNKEEMLAKEKELVDLNFIAREDTYNIIVGGGDFLTLDTVPVKDKDGNNYRVHKTDPRYLSGELKHNITGYVSVRDKNNNTFSINKNNIKYLSGELISITKNKIAVKDTNNNYFQIDRNDERFISGKLVGNTKGMITVKDINNNYLLIDIQDPRYLSGELVPIWKDRKHTEETKEKIGKVNSIKQKGDKNSQFGTCWITKDNINKKIKKEELESYLSLGWFKGRIINNGGLV